MQQWCLADSRKVEGERGASAGIARAEREGAQQQSVAEPLKRRGVSSTVKLPVSKTGLGGSNPSAPAMIASTQASRRVLSETGFENASSRESNKEAGFKWEV